MRIVHKKEDLKEIPIDIKITFATEKPFWNILIRKKVT